ncbi:MAG: hypothetical protein ABFS17_12535 [Chloroflexota bacterium]
MNFLGLQTTERQNASTFEFSLNLYWLNLIGVILTYTLTYIMLIWSHEKEAVLR